MAKKFLDYVGLQALWGKIKSTFATKNDVSKKADKNHKQAYITSELDTYTADDNIGVSAAGVKKCVNTFALGKTETAVKAKGVADTHDGRELKFRYGKEGSQVSEWYPMWEGNTLTCVQRELVKNDLGINQKLDKLNPTIEHPNSLYFKYGASIRVMQATTSNYTEVVRWSGTKGEDFSGYGPEIGCHNTANQIIILPYNTTIEPWSATVGLVVREHELLFNNKRVATEDQVNNAVSTANSASSTASNADAKAQQAINQINSVNQDKITKGDLVFSLSGSTLTITKRY